MPIVTRCLIPVRGGSVPIIIIVVVREVIADGYEIIWKPQKRLQNSMPLLPNGPSKANGTPNNVFVIFGQSWHIKL